MTIYIRQDRLMSTIRRHSCINPRVYGRSILFGLEYHPDKTIFDTTLPLYLLELVPRTPK